MGNSGVKVLNRQYRRVVILPFQNKRMQPVTVGLAYIFNAPTTGP